MGASYQRNLSNSNGSGVYYGNPEGVVWFVFSFLAGSVICQMTSEPHSFDMKIIFWLNLAIPDL